MGIERIILPGEVPLSGFVIQKGRKGIILLHGFTNCAKDFSTYASRFADAGFTVAAFDLRGHGASGGRLEIDGMVSDVGRIIEFLRERGVRSFGLFGYSLGGTVVTLAALKYTVDAVVALATPLQLHVKVKQPGTFVREMAELEKGRRALGLKIHLHDLRPKSPKKFKEATTKLAEAASLIQVPYLCILGDRDCFTTTEKTKKYMESVPSEHKELFIIPGNHLLPFTELEKVFEVSKNFFTEHLGEKRI